MSSLAPPGQADAMMRDANFVAVSTLPTDVSTFPCMASPWVTQTGAENIDKNFEHGFYPSEITRLTVCMRIMHVWRHDSVAHKIEAFLERNGLVSKPSQFSATGFPRGMWEPSAPTTHEMNTSWAAPASGAIAQLVVQVRARSIVLCLACMHLCNDLLSVRFVGLVSTEEQGILSGSPHMQFQGSQIQFRLLISLIEVALHLLHTHLALLVRVTNLGGATMATNTTAMPPFLPNAPRLALVVQNLRVLKQFCVAVGYSVGLVERIPEGTAKISMGVPRPAKTIDLTFMACAATRVEELLLELQSL